MTHLCRTSFDILGDLAKVSRQAMEHFFQIVLPRRFGQLPSMVRLLMVIRCAVHNDETLLARKPFPVRPWGEADRAGMRATRSGQLRRGRTGRCSRIDRRREAGQIVGTNRALSSGTRRWGTLA